MFDWTELDMTLFTKKPIKQLWGLNKEVFGGTMAVTSWRTLIWHQHSQTLQQTDRQIQKKDLE